jgi:small conductance mechanosensitive channel
MCGFWEHLEATWSILWLRRLIICVCITLAALVITSVVRGLIRRRMRKRAGQNLRADTLSKLLKSVVSYVVWFLAGIQILKTGLNVDVTGILAAAGVLGLAVGFGAQALVRDVITGFFLVFENQFSVGENVTIDGFTGTVHELGLRATKIRGDDGSMFIIPNGSIAKVINLSRGKPPEQE